MTALSGQAKKNGCIKDELSQGVWVPSVVVTTSRRTSRKIASMTHLRLNS